MTFLVAPPPASVATPSAVRPTVQSGDPATPRVCPTELALDVIACKWTVRIIYLLAETPVLRFSELRRALGSVTHKELTKQLRRLEQHGLVAREVFAQVPPRVEYRLSPLGATLVEPLQALSRWAVEHAAAVGAALGENAAKAEGPGPSIPEADPKVA
jgi:DNA-binding HxlR family transcriptional regulator